MRRHYEAQLKTKTLIVFVNLNTKVSPKISIVSRLALYDRSLSAARACVPFERPNPHEGATRSPNACRSICTYLSIREILVIFLANHWVRATDDFSFLLLVGECRRVLPKAILSRRRHRVYPDGIQTDFAKAQRQVSDLHWSLADHHSLIGHTNNRGSRDGLPLFLI